VSIKKSGEEGLWEPLHVERGFRKEEDTFKNVFSFMQGIKDKHKGGCFILLLTADYRIVPL